MQPAESLPTSRAVACVPASTSCVNRIRDYCTIKNIPRRIIPEGGGVVLVALTPTCYIAMRVGIRRSHRPHLSARSATLVTLSWSLFLFTRISHSLSLSLTHPVSLVCTARKHACTCAQNRVRSLASLRENPRLCILLSIYLSPLSDSGQVMSPGGASQLTGNNH